MRAWIVQWPAWIAALLGPLLLLAMMLGSARAQEGDNAAWLDNLFGQLRIAPDAEAARIISDQIWSAWTHPDDPVLAGRMQAILGQRVMGNMTSAVTALKELVEDYPDYAEGWNQLATLYFMMDDYDASLEAIDKVLQFEPRHFGALAGRAMIYRAQGKQALAVRDIKAALALHPFLAEKALFPELLDGVTRI